MKRKRIMLIGPRGSGKSTLANVLNAEDRPLRQTQDTIYRKYTLDVPSGYLENSWMYQHLIALSQDAWCILVLVDGSKRTEVYSPGFAKTFRCPVVGVISKCDLCSEGVTQAEKELAKIGVRPPYFAISAKSGEGLERLITYLKQLEGGKGVYEIYHRE
ncbi:MAG: EutP/PduV family microcompartment system protein [Peptococcaceae bacterium]|nr:EutP/PduV family microcompartment system protein [Peptococcaceae bacterium]